MSAREKKMLMALVPLLLIVVIRYAFFSGGPSTASTAVVSVDSAPLAEKRLAKMRQIAATVPGKQAVLNQVDAELAAREKGIISADTAAQAQAHLLEVARRDGKAENIDVRGGELGQVRNFSADYGEASVSVSFECHIHEFVNFMATISHEPELIAPQDLRINPSGNPKEKNIQVRMTLSGLVPKKLVPEKKGFSSF